jgi:hypothetical protein
MTIPQIEDERALSLYKWCIDGIDTTETPYEDESGPRVKVTITIRIKTEDR